MSPEAPITSDSEPRSIANVNDDQKLADYEQKVADLETRRLEGLDRAILLEEKVSGLEAKILALEKAKEEAEALSQTKAAALEEVTRKLRDLELPKSYESKPNSQEAAGKPEDRIAELEAKNKSLEQKIQKNNAQKQAFAEQFDKLEEQLAQTQIQTKVLQEKIAYMESSSAREAYSKLEQQYKELQTDNAAMVEKMKSLENDTSLRESLAEAKSKADLLEKRIEELQNLNNIEAEKNAALCEKLAATELSIQSQVQSKIEALEKQLEEEKKISKGLQETLASTFESDLRDKEVQLQKIAALNLELQTARESHAIEKANSAELMEKASSLEKAKAALEQQLYNVNEQLQLSETRVLLQIEKAVSQKNTLMASFDAEKAELVKKLGVATEQLSGAESALKSERELCQQLTEKLALLDGNAKSDSPQIEVSDSISSAKESEISELNAKINASMVETQNLTRKLSSAENRIIELTKELEENDTSKSLLQDDIKLLVQKIAEYESKLLNYESKVSELSAKNFNSFENLRSLDRNSEAEKSSIEQKLINVENEKKAALARISELEKKLHVLENPSLASKKFLEDNGEVKPSVSTIKNALQQKVAENASPKSKYKGLGRRVTKIESRIEESGHRPTASEDHHVKQMSETDNSQDLANDLAKKVAQLQTERKIALDKIQVMEQKLGYSESKMLAMGHKMTETEQQKTTALEKVQELEKKINELELQFKKLQAESGSAMASQPNAMEKCADHEKIIENLNGLIAERTRAFEAEKAEFTKLQETSLDAIKVLEKRNAELDAKIAEKALVIGSEHGSNEHYTELEKNIIILQNEKAENNAKLAVFAMKSEEWEVQRAEQVRELEDLKMKIENLHTEKSAAISLADQLQATLAAAETLRKQVLNDYKSVEESVKQLQLTKSQLDVKVNRLLLSVK